MSQYIVNEDGLVAEIPDNYNLALQVRAGWLPATPEQIAAYHAAQEQQVLAEAPAPVPTSEVSG